MVELKKPLVQFCNRETEWKYISGDEVDPTLFSLQESPHVQLLWKTDVSVEFLLVARLSGR